MFNARKRIENAVVDRFTTTATFSRRTIVSLLLASMATSVTGCWRHWIRGGSGVVESNAPHVFGPDPPTLNDVLFAVNANFHNIQQMQSDSVQLSAGGFRLSGSIAIQTPRNFRLQAGISRFTGQDLDIGSNNERMWFWTKWHQDPALYHVQHHQFETSAARQLMPIHPKFLTEALGLVYLDPSAQHDGPFQAGPNRIQIRTMMRDDQTGRDMTRLTTLDDRFGWILEQELQDEYGRTLAKSTAQGFRFYPTVGASLPHQVDVRLGPGMANEMAFHITVSQYNINSLMGNPAQLWNMPNIEGARRVDLGGTAQAMPAAY